MKYGGSAGWNRLARCVEDVTPTEAHTVAPFVAVSRKYEFEVRLLQSVPRMLQRQKAYSRSVMPAHGYTQQKKQVAWQQKNAAELVPDLSISTAVGYTHAHTNAAAPFVAVRMREARSAAALPWLPSL